MSSRNIDPSEMLARTRRSWSPEGTTVARVRRDLDARLVSGADVPPSTAPLWPTRLLLAGAFSLAVGGAGYWAGYRAGQRKTSAPVVVPALVSAPSAIPVASPVAVAPLPSRPAIEASVPAPVVVPDSHRQTRSTRASTESAPAGRHPEEGSLAIELRAVRNAERALRDGSPGLALAFLHDLDRRVPHGELTEEREAAATLARCAQGDQPFGVNLGEDFTTHHPTSVYRGRVEQACARTDASMSGDSTRRRSGP